MPRKLLLLLALFAAFLVSQSIALGAAKTVKWDPTFGRGGTANLPRYGSARDQSVTMCTRSTSGKISVFGSFGKTEFPPSRSAVARVSASGAVGKFRSGRVWARTKSIKYEGGIARTSDGGLLYLETQNGIGPSTITRLDSRGRLDKKFGRRGNLRIATADAVGVFPLDEGEFLVTTQQGATTSVRRYSPDGKQILRFGGKSGVQISGTVRGASSFSSSGSIVLTTLRTERTPQLGVELVSADGQFDSNFISAGLAGVQSFGKAASVHGLEVHNGRIFALVITHDVALNAFRYRVAQLNGRGELVGVSGNVDTEFIGDPGEPSELDKSFWATPRGVVYARIEQWSGRSSSVRYSLWRTPLSERPVFERQIRARDASNASRYFVAQDSVLSADSRHLIVCGSSAVTGKDGERRRNVSLRRLRL